MYKKVVFPILIATLFLGAAVESLLRGQGWARICYWLAAAALNLCIIFFKEI